MLQTVPVPDPAALVLWKWAARTNASKHQRIRLHAALPRALRHQHGPLRNLPVAPRRQPHTHRHLGVFADGESQRRGERDRGDRDGVSGVRATTSRSSACRWWWAGARWQATSGAVPGVDPSGTFQSRSVAAFLSAARAPSCSGATAHTLIRGRRRIGNRTLSIPRADPLRSPVHYWRRSLRPRPGPFRRLPWIPRFPSVRPACRGLL